MPLFHRLSWPGLAVLLGLAAGAWWLSGRPADADATGPDIGRPGDAVALGAAWAGAAPQPALGGGLGAVGSPGNAAAGSIQASSAAPPGQDTPGARAPAAAAAAPTVLTPSFIQASLEALRQHGVDLRRPLRNQHVLEVTEHAQLQALQALLRTAGFGQARVHERLDHGSQPVWVVEVERLSPAEPLRILAEGQQLRALAVTAPGVQYATWQPLPP